MEAKWYQAIKGSVHETLHIQLIKIEHRKIGNLLLSI